MNDQSKMVGVFLRLTEPERLLISRASELSARAENYVAATSFLSPREQRIVLETVLREGRSTSLYFWGGRKGCERRIAFFLPAWMAPDEPFTAPLFSREREEAFLSLLANSGMEEMPAEFISQ